MSKFNSADTRGVEKRPAFNVPRPAAAGLKGVPPLPAGEIMIPKSVSPGERAVLEKFGWRDGDPVPTNFADIVSSAQQARGDATDTRNMPPPIDLKTPALKLPKEVDIKQLPPTEREKYALVLNALSEAKVQQAVKEELGENYVDDARVDASAINQAIKAATLGPERVLTIEDDRDSDTYASGAKKTLVSDSAAPKAEFCPHCGYNQSYGDVAEVTDEDKINFLQALLGLQPFSKSYTVFGGRLRITVRTLLPHEADLCFRQLYLDRAHGRTKNPAEEAEYLARYKSSIQVTAVVGPGVMYTGPDNVARLMSERSDDADTTIMSSLWEEFAQRVDTTETMHRLLLSTVLKFDRLVKRLEDNVDNTDFWPAID